MNKTSKLELLSFIVLIGFFAAVLFHYIVGVYLQHPYPMNTFLCEATRSNVFADFDSMYAEAKNFAPYWTAPSPGGVYFPFAYIPYFFFALFPEKMGIAILLTLFLGFLFYFCHYFFQNNYFEKDPFANKVANLKNIFILAILTYPSLFCFERGNAECIVFIFTGLFLIFYTQQKFYLSAFFLACAAAMKGYTGIFIFLFLIDKHYKEALTVCLLTALLTIASMLTFKTGLALQVTNLQKNLDWFKVFFVENNRSLNFNATLYSLMKATSHAIHHVHWSNTAETSDFKVFLYSIFAGCILIGVLIYLFIFEKIFWKKVAVLGICGQILPQVAMDYHMIQLYLPLFLFVNAKITEKNDRLYTILWGLFFIPKNYHMLYGSYSMSSFLNTLILIAILGLIVFEKRSSYANYILSKIANKQ